MLPNSTHTVLQLFVALGTHRLEHVEGVAFGAFMYGQAYHESYGYPAGMKVVNLTKVRNRLGTN